MKAKSITAASAEELKNALDQNMADGFQPTLAIVLISIHQNRDAFCKVLDDAGIAVFGATTNGSFIDDEVQKESASLLLLAVNPDYFYILLEEYPDKKYREVAAAMATKTLERFAHPTFLIAGSHVETDAEQLLFGFEDVIGKQVSISGCMAGDDFTFTEQFVFTSGHETNRGIVMLAFDEEKIKLKSRATCGWHPVGTVRTVTKSEGNHVYTVDDIPVVDLTIKFGGLKNLSPTDNLTTQIAAIFPLQLQRDAGDPVMRPGLLIDWNDHSFYCSGSVPQGAKVRFSLPPDFDVIEKVIHGCEDLKATEMSEADALVVFSCAGRLMAFGPLINEELEGLRRVWDVPMAGMFSNAELARATGGNLEMHNLTTCVVALKEK